MFKASYCLRVHNAHLKLASAVPDEFIKLTSHRPKKQQYVDVYRRKVEITQCARMFKGS